MTRRPTFAPAACACLLLAGCMSFSGLSGSSSYACKAPKGVTCDSVSGTYANAIHNNLPGQRARSATTHAPMATASSPSVAAAVDMRPSMPTAAAPLRSSARILRLWFKPWEDADRDLFDQGYVYVQVDGGRWLIEHAQRRIREAYAPLRPPPRPASGDARDGSALPISPRGVPRPLAPEAVLPALVPAPDRPNSPDSTD
jgi:conjugal transfer pilus assembly protein TraV